MLVLTGSGWGIAVLMMAVSCPPAFELSCPPLSVMGVYSPRAFGIHSSCASTAVARLPPTRSWSPPGIHSTLHKQRRRLALRKVRAWGDVQVCLRVLRGISKRGPGAGSLVKPDCVLGFVAAHWSMQHNRLDTRIDHHQDLADAPSLAVADNGDAGWVCRRQRAERRDQINNGDGYLLVGRQAGLARPRSVVSDVVGRDRDEPVGRHRVAEDA